jgi:hypothetical protein
VFLLFIFLLLLGGAGIATFVGGEVWTNYEEFFRLALPAITGLFGAAIGFYFGRDKAEALL